MENRAYIRKQFERYLNGELSEEEARQLIHHLQSSPDADFVQSLIASRLDHADVPKDEVSVKRLEESRERIHRRIKYDEVSAPCNINRVWHTIIAIAAAIAIFFAGYFILRAGRKTEMITVTAGSGQMRKIILPDSTQVWLNAGTALRYPERFTSKNRSVHLLNGQAFFKVVHDPTHPFMVHTPELTTVVYGTSFDIRAFRGDLNAGVQVETGKVGVTTAKNTGPALMLTAGEGALVSLAGDAIQKVSAADAGRWRSNQLSFSDEPLADVLHAIGRKHQVRMELNNPALLREKVTIHINNESLADVLQVLSLSNNFKYRIHDKSVIVN